MSARPRVSVVVATRDRLSRLRATLASVDAQTFGDFEVVLVDDASRDGTARWVRARAFPRLTLLRHARALGPSRSRNRACARARGELLAFLDHDDLWRPGYLAAMTRAFRSPETAFACSDHDVIDGRGRVVARRAMRRAEGRQPAFAALSGLERVPAFSATVVRRRAWEELGGFDEGFRLFGDDSDFACRVGLAYGPEAFAFVDRALVARRVESRRRRQLSGAAASAPLDALLARGDRLDPRRRDVAFDILRHRGKHRWWTERLLHG